jgi:hypothetical protein
VLYPKAPLSFEAADMEAKLKHLEFIQAAIARMATNSFLFKGWAVTIAAGLSAFAAVNTTAALLAIALVSTVMFWGLDGYYLWLERGFVALHYEVAAKSEVDIDFSMRIDKTDAAWRWLKTCRRYHLLVFYGSIVAVEAIGIFVIKGAK